MDMQYKNANPTSCQLKSNENTETLLKMKKAAINIKNSEQVISQAIIISLNKNLSDR